jgi:hypothetical protein
VVWTRRIAVRLLIVIEGCAAKAFFRSAKMVTGVTRGDAEIRQTACQPAEVQAAGIKVAFLGPLEDGAPWDPDGVVLDILAFRNAATGMQPSASSDAC